MMEASFAETSDG